MNNLNQPGFLKIMPVCTVKNQAEFYPWGMFHV